MFLCRSCTLCIIRQLSLIFIFLFILPKATEAKEKVQLAKSLVNTVRSMITREQYNVLTRQVQSIFTLSKETFIYPLQSHNALLVDAIKEQIKAGHLEQNAEFVNKVGVKHNYMLYWRLAFLVQVVLKYPQPSTPPYDNTVLVTYSPSKCKKFI